jgi:hypothetical protein
MSFALSLTAIATAMAAQPSCKTIEGIESLTNEPSLQFVIVGERHGTNEIPTIFGDLICGISINRRVNVALELPSAFQSQLDAYLTSDGGGNAKQALVGSSFWRNTEKSGTTSPAMFNLVELLRVWHHQGRVSKVIAMEPQYLGTQSNFSQSEWEKNMADYLMKSAGQSSVTLVLCGNIHAMSKPVTMMGHSYLPMAAYLPQKNTVTLAAKTNGGYAWNCMLNGCGPHSIGGNEPRKRGILMNKANNGPYNGSLIVGSTATPSAPNAIE